jgi:hypothetical protein
VCERDFPRSRRLSLPLGPKGISAGDGNLFTQTPYCTVINKTEKLDAHGPNRLQHIGTLPTVWIPPGPLSDLRELTRTLVALVEQRTRLKNRLSATLAKYSEGGQFLALGARRNSWKLTASKRRCNSAAQQPLGNSQCRRAELTPNVKTHMPFQCFAKISQ